MQLSLTWSGPVMATDDVTVGAARPQEEAMQQGKSNFQSIPAAQSLYLYGHQSTPMHDGIDLVCMCDAHEYRIGYMFGRG